MDVWSDPVDKCDFIFFLNSRHLYAIVRGHAGGISLDLADG